MVLFRLRVAGLVALALSLATPAGAQIQAMPPSGAAVPLPPSSGAPSFLGEHGIAEPPLAPAAPTADQVLYGSDVRCCPGEHAPVGLPVDGQTCWTWQLLPDTLLYKSYLAGPKEPRLGTQWIYVRDQGWLWDSTLGGRAGILRYGSDDAMFPEGWQLDIEGAAFPRLDIDHDRDLVSADFRCGVPLTTRRGPWEFKLGYYHISSHLGDEYLESHPTAHRTNYVRDNLVLGLGLRPHPDWRLYAETAYAFYVSGGADPFEFQFGAEYSPAMPTTAWGMPFAAANAHLRQENDFGGNVCVQAGWQWRGETGHLFRVGAHYLNGFSPQYQFYNVFEDQLGVGIWYDF